MTTELKRGLSQRHINMIAVGSAIGVGLFLGSANAIEAAGPSIVLAYALCGAAILFVIRALGEMAVANPVAGSFSRYAHIYIGPLAGFITGWTYWFLWAADGMAELSAISLYMKAWYPSVPSWVWAFSALIIMPPFNLIAIKAFGEFEFWVCLIKIVTVFVMLALGISMIFWGVGNSGVAVGISNIWSHGGFFPNGGMGWLLALPMVGFAYVGIEIIGTTAGEAKNPEVSLARAVNTIFWRVLFFYVGTLIVILAVIPWTEITSSSSPFVMVFDKMGIPSAAGIVNFALLTTALSALNAGLFSNGRMLFNLSEQGQAPVWMQKVNKAGIPVNAVLVSILTLVVGGFLNYFAPESVFVWMTAIATFGAIWTWGVILVSHYRYKKYFALPNGKFRAPLFPFGSIFAIGFLLLIFVVMFFQADTRVAVIVGPIWLFIMTVVYFACGHHKVDSLSVESTQRG
ncbi:MULTISPECIES: amino acid permease [unclassified Pseudomonas]|uniref:amino acid permease n=1 Tax=unclassified Pseudomonas TaxID=196821 RepID=UPI00128B36A1|nr:MULTISPECIES: amino acid permease [unclassified Pseudomonas]MPQ67196.1 amino acid permease [Pseudomonas sp. MWU12-2323]